MSASHGLLIRVSATHFVSHVHIMAVPSMLPLLPGLMRVNFTELGIAIGVFNIVSALVQAPLGFLVDRIGPKPMLQVALAVGSASFALVAMNPTYSYLIAAMVFAGLANGVYHPADYSLLSHGVTYGKVGKAFSIHTFAGCLGGAFAPPIMVGVASAWGARWSFAVAAAIGLIVLAGISGNRLTLPVRVRQDSVSKKEARSRVAPVGALLLLTLVFTMLSLGVGAIERFSVSVFVQGFDVALVTANLALTVFMFTSAFGVLAGGVLADRTSKHGYVAAGAFALASIAVAGVASISLSPLILVLALGVVGFLAGIVSPSRDMLVRAISPPESVGRTFGIVSTGFNVGGVVGPVLFGALIDRGLAVGVLWASACFMFITAMIVLVQERYESRAA